MLTNPSENLKADFIKAATWHGSLDEAEDMLAGHAELENSSIHIAAVLGNADGVHRFISADAGKATEIAKPFDCNALVYLCLSKYLRFGKRNEDGFLKAAKILLDAGADANSGFWSKGDWPEFETALYGAAGVAHHAGLTQLLLDYGADPNDEEAVYHSPETDDNDAMKALVETGRITAENLVMMLIRKHDWHDYEGEKYLLEHNANPNGERARAWFPIHHALSRNNNLNMIRLLLDYGADPNLVNGDITAIARAARHGRNDVLELFRQRGFSIELTGVYKLIAACAMDDTHLVNNILKQQPGLKEELMTMSGELLARFSSVGNLYGVSQLLNLGVDVNTPFKAGDGYFEIPKGSLAIHVAAWLAQPEVVKLLLARGAKADEPDANGKTPLALAIRACVDSYWMWRRSPDSVEALLEAGASVKNVPFPTGYTEVDQLLEKYRSSS